MTLEGLNCAGKTHLQHAAALTEPGVRLISHPGTWLREVEERGEDLSELHWLLRPASPAERQSPEFARERLDGWFTLQSVRIAESRRRSRDGLLLAHRGVLTFLAHNRTVLRDDPVRLGAFMNRFRHWVADQPKPALPERIVVLTVPPTVWRGRMAARTVESEGWVLDRGYRLNFLGELYRLAGLFGDRLLVLDGTRPVEALVRALLGAELWRWRSAEYDAQVHDLHAPAAGARTANSALRQSLAEWSADPDGGPSPRVSSPTS